MTDMGNATIRWRRVEQGADGIPYPRYERDPVSGPGPGVILMHELFGVTAPVAWLGDALVDAGFTVWIPELFESPLRSVGGAARKLRSCMTREFAIFARNKRRGIASPLGELAGILSMRHPEGPVGIVGMCFTGGFALAAAARPESPIVASVVSQPALPWGRAARADPGLSGDELKVLAKRAEQGRFCALGLRFRTDDMAPEERFTAIEDALGADAFRVIRLPREGASHVYPPTAHSVLTPGRRELPEHAVDRKAAEEELAGVRDEVVAFLRGQLMSG